MRQENFLEKKLQERIEQQAFRTLTIPSGKTDFCSNDYLGIIQHGLLETTQAHWLKHGSGGSRLLAGNDVLTESTEQMLAAFHQSPAALLFNSGYDANLGLVSSVAQRGDTIIYDQLSHASIRDGIRLSFAQSFSFRHNDTDDLERRLQAVTVAHNDQEGPESGKQTVAGNIFVVTESVFSMDGDKAPLEKITDLCDRYNANLIVDEAHATGVVGQRGEGLVQQLQLQNRIFARVITFGKAVGCHGAVVAGSSLLRDYLINFSRSFIYTTALPQSSVRAIRDAYALFPAMVAERKHLSALIEIFQKAELPFVKLVSDTPIQVVVIPGNEAVRAIAARLQTAGMDVRPILYPTVPKGGERLRIVLHAFNTEKEVRALLELLK